jgi:hypothetical protein
LAQDGEVLGVARGERGSERARRRRVQVGHRVERLAKRCVLLFVGEQQRFFATLRARRFEFARFGFGFATDAANRLGDRVEVGLGLPAQLPRHGEGAATELRQRLFISGHSRQFLREDRVEDFDVSRLVAVGRRPMPAATAAGDHDRQGEQKDSDATEAAPLTADGKYTLRTHMRVRSI